MTAPVLGPCSAWISGADVAACCSAVQTTNPAIFNDFAVAASQVLYQMSGEQFSGLCVEEGVRPCLQSCGIWGAANPGWHWGSWWAGGWGGSGSWGWGYDGYAGGQCGCQPLSQVRLGYPVVEIVEVKIDGAVVDPSGYRVDEYQWLVRLADTTSSPPRLRWWPACQDLAVGADQPGTFAVSYKFGVAPPGIGAMAAAQLACQLYLSCHNPGSCLLPVGVTKVVRQGITVERGVLADWFRTAKDGRGWRTGLPMVDAFLSAYNPAGLRRRPAVFSPDVQQYPRKVGT